MAERKKTKDSGEDTGRDDATPKRARRRLSGEVLRVRIAQIIWGLFALAALFLAVGALLIAVNANRDNTLVRFVLDTANTLDLGIFSRSNGIKHFTGDNAAVKNALLNWGLGAVAWLVLGRLIERLLRP